ncbi:MAG: ATP-binding protein [Elusimicrobiota bacterium]
MKDLSAFLITTGRTLAQMALYAPDHPAVKNMVDESHQALTKILTQESELILSSIEGKILVNGQPAEEVPEAALRPFLVIINTYGLHSMGFLKGITRDEMVAFFRLSSNQELKKGAIDLSGYLETNSIKSIQLNQARYAKIKEGEQVGHNNSLSSPSISDQKVTVEQFEHLPLNDVISKLIQQAIPDPAIQALLIAKVLDLVKKEIDSAIEKVVKEFNKEKLRITNERERTEGVLTNMADGVVVVDEAGRVLMMNPVAEQIYGVKLGDSLGKPLWEGVRGEQMVALAKDLTLPTEQPITKEVSILGDEDVKKTLRASQATVQDVNGRVVGMVSVVSDVTKQKELNRLQTEFMANVTHDLRSPIHAIKLSVAAILEGAAGPTTPEANKMLTVANKNIERLSRLINDLLDFSKIESGRMEINQQEVEIEPLLQEAASSMESWSKSRGVFISVEKSGTALPTFSDSDRILQVVNNLISNAIKFTPAGGNIKLRAINTQENGKNFVMVQVEDSGKGISEEDQKRIFERFVQLKQNEKHDIRGTGLGLSICRAYIDLHGGKLSVQSPVPGGSCGTVFSFTLPAMERSASVQSPLPPFFEPYQQKSNKKGFWKNFFRLGIWLFIGFMFSSQVWARPYSGWVRRVLSPNLIQLRDGTTVRYLGIQTPEQNSPLYAEAVAANRSWIENKEIQIRYGSQERDTTGAWLGYVFVEGILVNEELVKSGMATVSRLPNEKGYLPQLLSAERYARRKKKGFWSDAAIPALNP